MIVVPEWYQSGTTPPGYHIRSFTFPRCIAYFQSSFTYFASLCIKKRYCTSPVFCAYPKKYAKDALQMHQLIASNYHLLHLIAYCEYIIKNIIYSQVPNASSCILCIPMHPLHLRASNSLKQGKNEKYKYFNHICAYF